MKRNNENLMRATSNERLAEQASYPCGNSGNFDNFDNIDLYYVNKIKLMVHSYLINDKIINIVDLSLNKKFKTNILIDKLNGTSYHMYSPVKIYSYR